MVSCSLPSKKNYHKIGYTRTAKKPSLLDTEFLRAWLVHLADLGLDGEGSQAELNHA
jgi:hypothetical protein